MAYLRMCEVCGADFKPFNVSGKRCLEHVSRNCKPSLGPAEFTIPAGNREMTVPADPNARLKPGELFIMDSETGLARQVRGVESPHGRVPSDLGTEVLETRQPTPKYDRIDALAYAMGDRSKESAELTVPTKCHGLFGTASVTDVRGQTYKCEAAETLELGDKVVLNGSGQLMKAKGTLALGYVTAKSWTHEDVFKCDGGDCCTDKTRTELASPNKFKPWPSLDLAEAPPPAVPGYSFKLVGAPAESTKPVIDIRIEALKPLDYTKVVESMCASIEKLASKSPGTSEPIVLSNGDLPKPFEGRSIMRSAFKPLHVLESIYARCTIPTLRDDVTDITADTTERSGEGFGTLRLADQSLVRHDCEFVWPRLVGADVNPRRDDSSRHTSWEEQESSAKLHEDFVSKLLRDTEKEYQTAWPMSEWPVCSVHGPQTIAWCALTEPLGRASYRGYWVCCGFDR